MVDLPPPERPGGALRLIMGVIAGLSFLATLIAGLVAVMGFAASAFGTVLNDSGRATDSGGLFRYLIAIPLVYLATFVVAVIATRTGKKWAVVVASVAFAVLVLPVVLISVWLGLNSFH